MTTTNYTVLGKKYRRDIVAMMATAGRGHLGPAFSAIDLLIVLYEKIMKYDSSNPTLPIRDRLILSKGHGCLALYVLLAEKGFFPKEELSRFCRKEGILGGHPDHRKVPGVEASTGSLGHGLSVGVGIALSARLSGASFRTFVILGDGECNEGSVWEAALSAGKHQLSQLVVLVDYNKMQSYGPTAEVLNLEPLAEKWKSFGFETREVTIGDPKDLEKLLLSLPFSKEKPNAIVCHTIKGKGAPLAENNPNWHHKNKLTDEEIAALYQALED